uniref:Cytochrome b n=1 Tax=Porcellio dilatatus dilatatus TaxID=96810 RepID=A0A1P8DKF4_PORDI|nr:cytochrome b [Porcellio dilatatus dilatatus]
MNTRKNNPILKILNSALVDMPAPMNISMWWNFGSLLGLCLILQLISGLFLAMHYSGHVNLAFDNLVYICRDINNGWFLRSFHANGASMFFICLYLHIGRGMYFASYILAHTWLIGVTILFLTMATAFLGYVLPWGQMSLWGASVITNLLSTIPYVGSALVKWLWGGFAVDNPTLTRFFALHFLLPFVTVAMAIIHITLLHQSGSSNPLGVKSNKLKMMFHPYFTLKDLLGMIILFLLLIYLSLMNPYKLGDPENFNPANPLSSPPHIQPEWYYLFAYAILRSVPNKLGGVVALILSVMILYLLPLTHYKSFKTNQFYPLSQILLYSFISVTTLLTWIGAKPVEDPYILTGQTLTTLYFLFFLIEPITVITWNKMNTLKMN